MGRVGREEGSGNKNNEEKKNEEKKTRAPGRMDLILGADIRRRGLSEFYARETASIEGKS